MGSQEDKAFNLVKQHMTEASILEHYNPAKPLSTDASLYGIGTVLYHVLEDGTEKPFAYTSTVLNGIEKMYS